ncbi:MAG: ABC transporter ATP-binding protein [Synechococcaceae cyanobacterium SM2_3_2]|nr:ABC transporter ATP-binding protein [Synechococcaceae cyanobacterium SM2_3_2]
MAMPPILAGSRWIVLVSLIVYGLGQTLTKVGSALLIKLAFDRVLTAADPAGYGLVMAIGTGLLATAALTAELEIGEREDAERLGQRYATAIRITLFQKLLTLSPRVLQQRSQGAVALRFIGDLTAIRKWISLGLARLVTAAIKGLGVVLGLAFVSPVLALTVAAVMGIGFVLSLSLGHALQHSARDARRRLSQLAGNITEKISAVGVVQVFGQSQREQDRLIRQSRRLEETHIRRAVTAGQLKGLVEAITLLALGSVLMVGSWQVTAGQMSVGMVVATLTLVGQLTPTLRDLSRVQEYWHNAQVAQAKILAFLAIPSGVVDRPDAPDLVVTAGRLRFDQVTVTGGIHELSAEVEPGQVVVIVGPNGAGKSTLLALAARLLDPDSGSVQIDGQDLSLCNLPSVRRAVGMVSPDLPLLRGSIRKNLRYRQASLSSREQRTLWKSCGVDALLSQLPRGEKTSLAERGLGLSTGQRQRLMLARGLRGNPPILLLDEVDANLDPKSARLIDRIVSQYEGTVLLVTHRPERISLADVVWYLEDGRLKSVETPATATGSGSSMTQLFRSHSRIS